MIGAARIAAAFPPAALGSVMPAWPDAFGSSSSANAEPAAITVTAAAATAECFRS